jgi:hypothetical protein
LRERAELAAATRGSRPEGVPNPRPIAETSSKVSPQMKSRKADGDSISRRML